MTERKSVVLHNVQQGAIAFNELREWCKAMLLAGHKVQINAKPPTRTLEQNALMWSMLTEISRQVEWYGQRLTAADWKHVLSASLAKQRAVPGIEPGTMVVLGQSTSQMTKAEMSDLIELMNAFGAERGVKFSSPDA